MIYFIWPKQPTNLQANLRIVVQLAKRLASNRKVMGSIPAQTTCFFRIFLFISKEKVRACFFSARINQPTSCYFWHGEVRKKKKSGPVALRYFTCGKVSLEYRVQRVGCAARLMRCTGDRRQMAHLLRPDHGGLQRVVSTTVI